MSPLRTAELFAGAGGMALGLHRAGCDTVWLAEIADFPRRVLQARFPDVPLYGDVTELDGTAMVAKHGALDLIAGGSPCQDLSVAGKRKGLAGARSGLFHHQMRLWTETGADLCLWENVAGALSSHHGHDFAAVLSAFVGAAVAVPRDGWTAERCSGVVSGPAGVAAWRLLDAQYFGVPQRRLRVFVLGARAGRVDPAEILLEPEGVRWNPPASREAREGTPADAATGAPITFKERGRRDGYNLEWRDDGITNAILTPNGGRGGVGAADGVVAFDWMAGHGKDDSFRGKSRQYVVRAGDYTGALQAQKRDAVVSFVLGSDPISRVGGAAQPVTGRNGDPGCVVAFNVKQDGTDADTVAPSLLAMPHDQSHANGGGQLGVVCLTGDVMHALTHDGHDASEDGTGRGTPIVANAITAREAKGWNPSSSVENGPVSHGIPRRLMPIECERLMGWPDGWTDVPDENGKPASDSARYKACGNGVVSNVAQWIGERIVRAVA